MSSLMSQYDFSYISIVENKYPYLDKGAVRALCSKYNIELFFNTKALELIQVIIPKTLTSSGFLKKFYNKLQPNEKKILKFIVNYNGANIQEAVKKKFQFDIAIMTRNSMVTYVWWLELLMDNNEFEEVYKELFLEFLSTGKKQKNKNVQKRNNIQKNVYIAKELKGIIVNKCTLSGDMYELKLEELPAEDVLLAISVLYMVANDSKLKVTQKRALAVRSEKLLLAQMPEDYHFPWLINLLSENKYLQNGQLLLPTNKFHKLMRKGNGDIIKDIFKDILHLPYNNELTSGIFRASVARGDQVKNFREMIVTLIKEQEESLWINIDYLVNEIKINSKTMKYITNNYNYCYAFYGNSNRLQYNKIEHLKVVVRYFLKTFFGVMCQMGLCDLGATEFQAYNKEDVRILNGYTEYATVFGNVEFYKLTELGHYVLGLNATFKSPNDYRLLLNSYNYELKVENSNKLSDIYLEKIATKVEDAKYKIDIKSFMRNINSKLEYEKTKETFINKVEHLPQNWQEFFRVLDTRAGSISTVSKSVVLLKVQNNRDILKLISSNNKLQDKILKADRFHMVVMQKDFASVKNILTEYGVVVS